MTAGTEGRQACTRDFAEDPMNSEYLERAEEESPIYEALAVLDNQLERLDVAVSRLGNRISPILRPELKDSPHPDAEKSYDQGSRVRQRILNSREAALSILVRVESLVDRADV